MDAYTYLHFTEDYNVPSQPKPNVPPKVTPQITPKLPLKAIAKELVQPPASAPKTDYYLMPVMF